MRLRLSTLAFAAALPLRAFAQEPPPPPPPATAVPASGEMPPAEKPAVPQAPAATPVPPPPAVMVTPPPPPPPSPAAATPAPKLTWGGLVDTYWMYYFNPASGANSLTPPTLRAFDVSANSFNLSLAKLSLNASMDPVSMQLDVGYGDTASVVNGTVTAGMPVTPSFFVEQAYAEIALPGNLTIDFGKFVTTAGAEVIEANKNWLYSRSFLFTIIPFVHTGVRASLKVSDQLTLQASLVNNWGGVGSPDNNAWKTVGLSATATLSPMATIIATAYIGKEGTQAATDSSTPSDTTVLVDVVGAFTVSDKLGLNLNIDYVKAPPLTSAGDDHQIGFSVMGRYVLSDHLNLAARGEWLQNHFGGASSSVEEGTVMLGIDVGKNFELRPEVRADFSGDNVYAPDANGLGTKKNQVTGTIAALAWF
ncbi:MAG TPA: outer membrane beta-barrel protein [Polyangia bacterium]|nr:outer membrane beta-barrel protein [Polyangia bacterium]